MITPSNPQGDSPAAGDQKSTTVPDGEEKMEVDPITDGAGDASSVQVTVEPRQSLKDALKKMAADTDFLGFTPLLRACQVWICCSFVHMSNIQTNLCNQSR